MRATWFSGVLCVVALWLPLVLDRHGSCCWSFVPLPSHSCAFRLASQVSRHVPRHLSPVVDIVTAQARGSWLEAQEPEIVSINLLDFLLRGLGKVRWSQGSAILVGDLLVWPGLRPLQIM